MLLWTCQGDNFSKEGCMKKGLNSYQLKILPILIMVIDHAGVIFFPDKLIFRIIGRIAFPIFAFFISEGFFHTRSVPNYLRRLGICAIVFQVPDWFSRIYSIAANQPGFGVRYKFNIFATLFFGLLAVAFFDRLKNENIRLAWSAAAVVAVLAEIVGADYGAYGVLYIVVFYLSRGNIGKMLIGITGLHGAYVLYDIAVSLIRTGNIFIANYLQLYSILAIPLLIMYNNERGKNAKYFFYVFYPLHLIVLYMIDMII